MIRLSDILNDNYLPEEESDASKEAKRMGLIYKGFGRWSDPKTGKVTHVSQNGKLTPVGQKSPAPEPTGRTASRGAPEPGLGANSDIQKRIELTQDVIQRGVLPEPDDYTHMSSEDMYRMANTAIEKNIDNAEKLISDPTFRDKLANSIIEPHVKKYGQQYLDAAKRSAESRLRMLDTAFEKRAGRPIQVQDDGAEADYYNQQADKFASQDRGERGLDMDPLGQDASKEKADLSKDTGSIPKLNPSKQPSLDDLVKEPYADAQEFVWAVKSAGLIDQDQAEKFADMAQDFERDGDTAGEIIAQVRDEMEREVSGNSDQEKFKAADRAGELPTDGPPGPDTMGSEPPAPLKNKDPYSGITKDKGYNSLLTQFADIDAQIKKINNLISDPNRSKPGPAEMDRAQKLLSQLATKKKMLRQKISSYEKNYSGQ